MAKKFTFSEARNTHIIIVIHEILCNLLSTQSIRSQTNKPIRDILILDTSIGNHLERFLDQGFVSG